MAKLKTDDIGVADLTQYLDENSDFSFELQVLKMLRESNIECEHGGFYEDSVTHKTREFDIRATKTIACSRVRFAVECKNIRAHFPILISCVPRHEHESYHDIALRTDNAQHRPYLALNVPFSHWHPLPMRAAHSLYPVDSPVGKSTAQVGRSADKSIHDNDSELFEKWTQCLSSAADLVKEVHWDGEDAVSTIKQSAVLPFLVVPNGRLWSVNYDANGTRLAPPAPTDRCSYFVDKVHNIGPASVNVKMSLTHVEFVTINGMRSFIDEYLSSSAAIARIFPDEGIANALSEFAR